jgi:energy-dependent translational throttle protein EttA
MAQYVYVMKGVKKAYPGGKEVLKDLWLSFMPGAKIGIIGHNGAGKSTIMKIIAGMDKEYSGEAWAADGITVGYLPQEPALDQNLTVQENIMSGMKHIKDLLDEFEQINTKFMEELTPDEMDALIQRQGIVQEKIDSVSGWDIDRTLEIAMAALQCPPADSSVVKLSGGEKRRVALCRLLLQSPDILLLDEPTNHLDAESVAWLERHLKEYKGTVILVTHDRYFLDNVVGWILELDRGNAYPFEGNYSAWLDMKQKRLKTEEKQESQRQKILAQELDWIRQTPKARQVKSKARVQAYESLLQESLEKAHEMCEITIPTPPRLGSKVLEVKGLCKNYGDKVIIKDLSFSVPPGAIVGVIGPNGRGKTTLFRMITNQEKQDSGDVTIGETVVVGYVDQTRDILADNDTVWEAISEKNDEVDLGKKKISSRSYCAQFNFKGTDQQKKVSLLSGGERNRVHLARSLKLRTNLLLLDEPTNDLDLDTLRALEEALNLFPGCIMITSHDRFFLDRISTHTLAFEGDGKVVWFDGNYSDYERYTENDTSKFQYKPLKRA